MPDIWIRCWIVNLFLLYFNLKNFQLDAKVPEEVRYDAAVQADGNEKGRRLLNRSDEWVRNEVLWNDVDISALLPSWPFYEESLSPLKGTLYPAM